MTDTVNPTERTSLLNNDKKEEKWQDLIPHFPVLTASCIMSIVVGLNDGTIGFMIPRFKEYYGVSYQVLSLLFLCNAAGYIICAPLNGYFVHRFGQKGTLLLAGASVLLAYLIIMNGFDFRITCLVMVLQGSGIAILDAGMNVCTAHLPFATLMLNIVHAVYGFGAMLAPMIGVVILKYDISWRWLYVCICCISVINILVIAFTIHNEDDTATSNEIEEQEQGGDSTSNSSNHQENAIHPILNRTTILCAIYILIYVGLEVTLGGWGNAFLREAKHGGDIAASQVLSYYWSALAVGRIVLGYISGRYGERLVINICTLLCVFCVIGLWFIDDFIWVSVVFVFIGALLGPCFPTTIALASKVLPKEMHPTSIGFIAGVGAAGAAILPFISGLIAGQFGMSIIPILCLIMALVMEVAWILIPS
ncbi:major facilitator superfamily domain-containing protein [Cunninghamella echinulata]|nr:major facilitator superfamily domain-containing protein [Cunninghamella echinulata]